MFKDLSLRLKLTVAFLATAVLLAGVSVYQVRSLQHLDGVFSNLLENNFKRLGSLDQVKMASLSVYNQTLAYQPEATEMTASELLTLQQNIATQTNNMQASEQTYLDLRKAGGAAVSAQQVNAMEAAMTLLTQRSAAALATVNARPKAALDASARAGIVDSYGQLTAAVNTVIGSEQKILSSEDLNVHATVSHLVRASVVAIIAVTCIALALGLLLAAWMARSLATLQTTATRIANGDFSQLARIKSHDEIGRLSATFNSMAERLREAYRRQSIATQQDEAMLQSMSEGLIASDSRGRVTLVNKLALDYLGLSDGGNIIGKRIKDVYELYGDDPKATKPLPAESHPSSIALATGQTADGVYVIRQTDDRKRLFDIAATPVTLEDKTVGIITVMRDVTKEKEVDRMKTEFISLASHQLRTPLSAIKWFTEMLLSGDAGKLQPEQSDFAKNISDSTERMIALVNALLNISRIESGRIMVDPKPTDLKELVSGIVTDLKGKTEEKRQTLIISVHEDLPKINIDPRLIGQVYLNLLTNAIKYTPKGGEISVFISRKDNEIISQVADNGYGIPKEQQPRIFEKFFRATNAVKVETDGTGLGLYLIKAVVESSGGKIWFKSEEGKGTTFWFSIPASGMKPKEGEVTLDA